jgi:hypothetical protein
MKTKDKPLVYNAQCFNGHVMTIAPDSELEKLAKERIRLGAMDAFILDTKECPGCIEDRRDRARRDAEMHNLAGCWIHGYDCPDDCTEGIPEVIADSPYQDQVTGWSLPTRA